MFILCYVYIEGEMQKFWAFDFIALLDKDT